MKLAGSRWVNSGQDGERREAMAPGNRRLPESNLSLVRLRNRTKFRFASLRCSVDRFGDASQRFAFLYTTLT
jgi:hypothetical protein